MGLQRWTIYGIVFLDHRQRRMSNMKRTVFTVVMFLITICTAPAYARSEVDQIVEKIGTSFLDELFSQKKQWIFEIYNNTGCSIDVYLSGEYRKTLAPGESVVYKIRVRSGYYICFTVNARMNGYYSTRSYNFTVRYTDTCGPLPVTFTRYDFPSEAIERTQEGFVATVVNASVSAFEVFRDGTSLGVIQPGELKAFQTTSCIFLFRASQNKFTQKEVRSQSVIIIKDSDFWFP